jgi:hypothetical protein
VNFSPHKARSQRGPRSPGSPRPAALIASALGAGILGAVTLTTAAPTRAAAAETRSEPSGYTAGTNTVYPSGAYNNAAYTQAPPASMENEPTSVTTLSVSPGPYVQGEPISLTASVTCLGSGTQPAGYVRFHALTPASSQEATSTADVDPHGVAEGQLRLLAGEREIWAEHVGGIDSCTGGASARVPLTVMPAAAPSPGQGVQVHVVVSPSIHIVVAPGQSAVVSSRVGHRIEQTSRMVTEMPAKPVHYKPLLPVTG